MKTEKSQTGIWTLTAPDGRTWQAETPLKCVVLEQKERVPPSVGIERIKNTIKETENEFIELD